MFVQHLYKRAKEGFVSFFKLYFNTYHLFKPYFAWRRENFWHLLLLGLLCAGNIAKAVFSLLFYLAIGQLSTVVGMPAVTGQMLLRPLVEIGVTLVISSYCNSLNSEIAGKLTNLLKKSMEKWKDRWLTSRTFYLYALKTEKKAKADPAQVEQETVSIADKLYKYIEEVNEQAVYLSNNFMDTFLNFGIGLVGLWQLSVPFSVSIGSTLFIIPGFMMIAAILYSTFYWFTVNKLGEKLHIVTTKKKQFEEEKQARINHIEQYGAQLQMSGAIEIEKSKLAKASLDAEKYCSQEKTLTARLEFFVELNMKLRMIAGFLLNIPNILAKSITLDSLYLVTDYFFRVVSGFTWGDDNLTSLISMDVAAENLNRMQETIIECEALNQKQGMKIIRDKEKLAIGPLVVQNPEGKTILTLTQALEIKEGVTLIRGASGSGKTTLFRVLSGTWPNGYGAAMMPNEDKIHYMPQKAVFPLKATLYDAILYKENCPLDDDKKRVIRELWKHFLSAKEVEPLSEKEWDEEKDWSRRLSGGQQQIVSLIRMILSSPDVVFMDEPFSGLDGIKYEKCIPLLRKKLPHCKIIYIEHRLEAMLHYDYLIECQEGTLRYSELPKITTQSALLLHYAETLARQQQQPTTQDKGPNATVRLEVGDVTRLGH